MEMKLRDTTRGEGEGIPPAQYKTIIALLEQPTMEKAAKAAGVNKTTLYKWLREDAAFKEAYREARREAFSAAVARLQAAATQAVTALVEIAGDPSQQGAARVGACKAILDNAVKAVETEEILARVEALERGKGE
ncbi:MAG: hypothetical protein M3R38_04770 [Actinomycetota bacterium]|nr:hypothetical protein [Actinomycetota bacterium]